MALERGRRICCSAIGLSVPDTRTTRSSTRRTTCSDSEIGIIPFEANDGDIPEQNATLLYGSFLSQGPSRTANATKVAARTLWPFHQAFFSSSHECKTCDPCISHWDNSYGGDSVSALAAYVQKQNAEIEAGRIDGKVRHIDQMGIMAGCVDMQYQMEWYPEIAYDNVCGLQIVYETVYQATLHDYLKPGGYEVKIKHCHELGE